MPKILIVDDDPGVRRGLGGYLRAHRCEVAEASNGQEALELLLAAETPFHGMILDRSMDVLGGDDVLRSVRKNRHFEDLCIITLTAQPNLDSELEHARLHVWKYLKKPGKPEEILALLRGGIALSQSHAQRRRILFAAAPNDFVKEMRGVLSDSLGPDDTRIFFVTPDGNVTGDGTTPVKDRLFVHRILEGSEFVLSNTVAETRALGPIAADSKSLLAVPVRWNSSIEGILEMESSREGAFEEWWKEILDRYADIAGQAIIGQRMRRERDDLYQLQVLHGELLHAIATPLQILSEKSKLLADRNDPDISELASTCKAKADQIRGIITYLGDITGKLPTLNPQRTSLNDVISRVKKNNEIRAREAGAIIHPIEGPVVEVSSDTHWLDSILDIVVVNAIEAIDDRRRNDLDLVNDKKLPIRIKVLAGTDNATVAILDEGVGFEQKDVDLLFTPLYTTKRQDSPHSRGYGLFTARRILTALNSTISATSDGNFKGARFEIRLPLCRGPRAKAG